MRLPRTDLVPVLAIIAGGAIGALLSVSFLLLAAPDDVPSPSATVVCGEHGATDPLHQRRECAEARYLAARDNDDWLEEAQRRLERDRMVWRRENQADRRVFMISPNAQWIAYQSDASGEPRIYVRNVNRKDGNAPMVVSGSSFRIPAESPAQPLVYIDGVRIGTSFIESLDPDDIESIEIVKGEAAVALYGEEASTGVIRISLKEERH